MNGLAKNKSISKERPVSSKISTSSKETSPKRKASPIGYGGANLASMKAAARRQASQYN
jgi:hypothetical protein